MSTTDNLIDPETLELCKSPPPGSVLEDKCLCIKGFIEYANRTKVYQDSIAKYNDDFNKYQIYLAKKDQWEFQKNQVRTAATNVRFDGNTVIEAAPGVLGFLNSFIPGATLSKCEVIGQCPAKGTIRYNYGRFAAPDEFQFEVEYDICNRVEKSVDSFLGKIYYTEAKKSCKLTQATIDGFVNAWTIANPAPSPVAEPQRPSAPSGDNIQCCVNIIRNIEAENIEDVKQSCSQTIVQQVADAASKTSTTPQPITTKIPITPQPTTTKIPITPIPVTTNNIKNILLGLAITFYIITLVLLIILFKSKNKAIIGSLFAVCLIIGTGTLSGYFITK